MSAVPQNLGWQERAAQLLYSLLWWPALPLVLLRLWWRGRREPMYRQHWRERLALYPRHSQPSERRLLWLHAVSVGETRAAQPLVEALLTAYPQMDLLLTHMTPTGRATGAQLFAQYGKRVQQVYLPYDIASMQRRFLRHFAPKICILMETEVWPNSIAACQQQQIPIALVNARLSQRSLRKALRMANLMRPASRALSVVAAQTKADSERIQCLGAPLVQVSGSIKFDVQVPDTAAATAAALRARLQAPAAARKVLLCASTREGEEELILRAFQAALGNTLPADLLLLLVPRHPQRFGDVEKLVQAHGLHLQRRSEFADANLVLSPQTQVLLGDSMGEMFVYCGLADLVFIGGSLLPLGGQNPIEACAIGKPVLFGPHTFNFEWVCEQAVAGGAARRVQDAQELMQAVHNLFAQPESLQQMGGLAYAFASQHKGASARTMAMLADCLR